VWDKVFAELSKDADSETFMIDATIVRAHQDATGAEKKTAPNPSAIQEADQPRRFTLLSTPWEIRSGSCSRKDREAT